MQKKKEEKEFENHVRENELLIHKVCRMYAFTEEDRQDLFQEIVIQLWKSFSRYRGEAKLSTWIYRVAINTSISRLRKKKDLHTSTVHLDLAEGAVKDHPDQEEEQLQILYKAIALLNKIEKAIVMLYMEERNYQEMEEILGISQGTLRVKMNRIKEKLRQLTKSVEHGA